MDHLHRKEHLELPPAAEHQLLNQTIACPSTDHLSNQQAAENMVEIASKKRSNRSSRKD